MRKHSPYCIGIDLGTSNSSIATCRIQNGKLKTITKSVMRRAGTNGSRSDPLLPSCVFYFPNRSMGTYDPIVGDYAKEMYSSMPHLVAKSIKSQMGQTVAEGLQSDIPDKTPEAVSARIIHALLTDLSKHLNENITDAVITVPASFDPAQRYATLKAAELAGLEVRDSNGNFDQSVLLSEPEAVMYYLLNEIKNGSYDATLDFSEPKKVMIFDIGGGTLDITMHIISMNEDNPDLLDMQLIATNRYTPVAGDTFDKLIARAMYDQYIATYRIQSPAAASVIEQKRESVLADLLAKAEELKLNINSAVDDADYCGRNITQDMEFDCGGSIVSTGYLYNGYFTKEEFEKIIEPLLGKNYTYDDYRQIDGRQQTEDIIWPILDVLRKAAKKLGTDDIVPDKVIMSGGMSKLYIIKDRLEEFFGTHIISVPDPDLAVAKGAVVYHSHQHQYMDQNPFVNESQSITNTAPMLIKSSTAVLADSIFLGLKGGATHLLADEGQALPYTSPLIEGFKIEGNQKLIAIPIKKKGTNPGEFVTIASGNISFEKTVSADSKVSIKFVIDKNQLITIDAYTETPDGKPLEHGTVTFALGESKDASRSFKRKSKADMVTPPAGAILVPSNEISGLVSMCYNYKRNSSAIKSRKARIACCGNPQDFGEAILKSLKNNQRSVSVCLCLIPLARKLSQHWTPEYTEQLVKFCCDIIKPKLVGLSIYNDNSWRSVYNESILTIGLRGNAELVEMLYNENLLNDSSCASQLMHIFGIHGKHAEWIASKVYEKVPEAIRWIGCAIDKSENMPDDFDFTDLVDELLDRIFYNNGNMGTVTNCIISLGLICSKTSKYADKVNDCSREDAYDEIQRWVEADSLATPATIALKLITGDTLETDEEQYLLSFYDDN